MSLAIARCEETSAKATPEKRIRVLIVDDDAGQRKLLKIHLVQRGFDVVTAADGAEALQLARREPPDAIVSDVLMPNLDGFGLCLAVRRDPALMHVPLVLCSASYDGELDRRLAADVGASAFISRVGGDMDAVLEALARNLDVAPPPVLRAVAEIEHDHLRCAGAQVERQYRGREVVEQRYHALMNHAEDAISMVDEEGLIIEVNRAFTELVGRPREQILGRSFLELVALDERDRDEADFRELVATGQPLRRLVRVPRPDGPVLEVELSAALSEVGGVINVVVVGRDVTERNRLEAQLRQNQKMDALGRFTGGVAHDFNNLMAVVLTSCELLLEDMDPNDLRRTDVETVQRASQRAAALTRQLTAFSRTQVAEPTVVGLNSAIVDVWKMIQRVIGEDVRLVTEFDPAVGNALIDVTQLEQVVMNLVINARHAMPRGGTLTLATANLQLDETAAALAGAQPGRYVRLTVSDEGIGMDEAVKARIFEPFFTTREKGDGCGLGLSTVFGIVQKSGGFITVRSAPGQGASFAVHLPRVDRAVEAAPTAVIVERESRRWTILLLEDEEMVRSGVQRTLKALGHTVLIAESAASALQVCARTAPRIDLLLTDVVMPEVSGVDVAAQVTALQPEIKVLFMSGFVDHATVRQSMAQTQAHFIAKPFTSAALVKKLRVLLS